MKEVAGKPSPTRPLLVYHKQGPHALDTACKIPKCITVTSFTM